MNTRFNSPSSSNLDRLGIIWKAWKNMNDVIDDPQLGYNFPFVLSVNLSTNLSIV